MAKARKATLVCRPCGYGITISDLGSAVIECYECGLELVPQAGKSPAARKALKKAPAAKKAPVKATKKAAPKKKK